MENPSEYKGLMHCKGYQKGTFTNSVDPYEMPHVRCLVRVCAVCQAKPMVYCMISNEQNKSNTIKALFPLLCFQMRSRR